MINTEDYQETENSIYSIFQIHRDQKFKIIHPEEQLKYYDCYYNKDEWKNFFKLLIIRAKSTATYGNDFFYDVHDKTDEEVEKYLNELEKNVDSRIEQFRKSIPKSLYIFFLEEIFMLYGSEKINKKIINYVMNPKNSLKYKKLLEIKERYDNEIKKKILNYIPTKYHIFVNLGLINYFKENNVFKEGNIKNLRQMYGDHGEKIIENFLNLSKDAYLYFFEHNDEEIENFLKIKESFLNK